MGNEALLGARLLALDARFCVGVGELSKLAFVGVVNICFLFDSWPLGGLAFSERNLSGIAPLPGDFE